LEIGGSFATTSTVALCISQGDRNNRHTAVMLWEITF